MSIRAIFGAVLIFVTPIGAALSEDNVGIGVVDAMNKLFGKHEGFRAFHAKGTVVEGSFKGTSDGAAFTPDSFAHEEYRGLNAFLLVDTSGRKRAVRWIVVPERVVHVDPAEAAKWSPNYLMDEIRARLAKGPVTFRLEAQMAEPGDPTSDPSRAWPEDRSRISIGVLTLDKAVNDGEQAEKKLLFLPGQLLDGIEPSDDPMIDIRNSAYAESFSRRNP